MNLVAATPATAASLTSFAQLFGRTIDGITIREIEIPLVQRDYAQGRKGEGVSRIREDFINALCGTLLPSARAINLDFIFGDVEEAPGENQGKFYPLDGQQRLTALFLLHCYLAWRAGVRPQDQPWRRFGYATRPGARDFCEYLVQCEPVLSDAPSAWIRNDAGYLPTWDHDPTIQSMLVVLDALHGWFAGKRIDLRLAWDRLTDPESPAIRFHLLPMKANGLTDALYIKMNSRGRSLTPFESFKAHFEELLKKDHPGTTKDFGKKVDTDWSDILWPYRGADHLIDDEFLRYFRFVTEICAWKSGIDFKEEGRADDLATQVYGAGATHGADNLSFLVDAWDAWKGKDIKAAFERMLTSDPGDMSGALLMFSSFDDEGVDLFHACCRHYGTRQWTLGDTLLLYGVLLGLIHDVAGTSLVRRMRMLRNLVAASGDEIRAGENSSMSKLLVEVEAIVRHESLQDVATFNQIQVKNEEDKVALLKAAPVLEPDLHTLEDHPLLRGGLTVFDLDPGRFAQRTRTFISVFDKSRCSGNAPWSHLTAALLAKGDYSRGRDRWTGHRVADFGSPKNDDPWRELFRGKKGEPHHPARASLMALLDAVAAGGTLQAVADGFLNDPNTARDWRYYFVKYGAMRSGSSGRYTISKNHGYQVCMLEYLTMQWYYYDPYLLAMAVNSRIKEDRIGNARWPRCFSGYETDPRVLTLRNSGLAIRAVDCGWQLSEIPADAAQRLAFDKVCAALNIGPTALLSVAQTNGVDAEDRIERGAALLNALVGGGL